MKLRSALSLRVLPMLLVATGISSASSVVLDATKQGAVFTTWLAPGGAVTSLDLPVIQLVSLAAGTYTITDGDTSATGSAWDFSYGTGTQSNGNWVWQFCRRRQFKYCVVRLLHWSRSRDPGPFHQPAGCSTSHWCPVL